jgi:HEAT repeat protein
VRLDGTKELVAIRDGYRASTDSWADLLCDLKRRRGMRAPMVAVGDGALGLGAALREVWPETREQRDWVHKLANVLDALAKSVQPSAKKMLAEIGDAEDRDHAIDAAKRLDAEFRTKVAKGPGSRAAGLAMAFKLIQSAQDRWRAVNGPHPVALVRAAAVFRQGLLVEAREDAA